MQVPVYILSTLLFVHFVSAVPAVITSTKATTITSCSCTSTSKSGTKTSTITYSSSAACSSKKIQPTCKTTTSTTKILVTSTSTAKSSSSTKTSSTTTSKPTTSSATSSAKSSTSSLSSSSRSSSSSSSTSTSSTMSATPTINSGPRGLAYNDPSLTQPFSLSGQGSETSWSYNWYSFPYTQGQAQSGYNLAIEFVPMLWSAASVLTSVWSANVAAAKAQYRTKAVLAFNEPDLCWDGTSCMSVSDAVTGWLQYMQPLKGSVRLGAPAVSNSAQPGQGLEWLRSFLSACSNCTFDFVPVHWYGDPGDVAGFQSYITQAYAAAGERNLWITEFGTQSGTASQTYQFLKSVMAWLDSGSGKGMVERYAWFMDATGNLINANGTGLSDLGTLYNSG